MASDRRLQVDPGLRTPTIQPVAAPVDSFIRPTAGNGLDQLGAALSQISPEVREFTGAVSDHIDANAQSSGRLAAEKLRTEGLTLAEATRKGLIPASSNPWFMAGLREQLGRNMADKYDGDLRAAMGQDENLQTSTNLSDYDAFASKFREQWTKDNIGEGDQDQHFSTGFQFRAGAYESQARDAFASGIEEKVKTQGDEATHQEVVGAIQHGLRANVPLNAVADGVNTLVNDLIAHGRNGAVVLRTVATAVHDAAIADPQNANSILKMLGQIKGKNGALDTTSYGMALAEKAQTAVAEKLQRSYTVQHEQQAAQKQKQTDSIFAQVNDALDKAGDNAHNVDMRPFKELMNQVNPEHVATIDAMQNAWVSHDTREDPHVADDLLIRLHTVNPGEPGYVTMGSVAAAFGNKQISKSTFNELAEALSKRDTEKSITADKFYTEGQARVSKAFANEFGDVQENRLRAERAVSEFSADYIREFSGKTGAEFDAAKNKFIVDHIKRSFATEGTTEDRKAYNSVGAPNLAGPQRADPNKILVVDVTTQRQLQAELTAKIEGHRNALSPALLDVLRANGVEPKDDKIQQFIYQQKRLYESGQRIPTNPNP